MDICLFVTEISNKLGAIVVTTETKFSNDDDNVLSSTIKSEVREKVLLIIYSFCGADLWILSIRLQEKCVLIVTWHGTTKSDMHLISLDTFR